MKDSHCFLSQGPESSRRVVSKCCASFKSPLVGCISEACNCYSCNFNSSCLATGTLLASAFSGESYGRTSRHHVSRRTSDHLHDLISHTRCVQGLYFGCPARALSPPNGAPLFWVQLLKRAGNNSPDWDVFCATRLLRCPMHPARMRTCICTIPVKVCEVPASQVAKFGVDSFRKFLIEICKAGGIPSHW